MRSDRHTRTRIDEKEALHEFDRARQRGLDAVRIVDLCATDAQVEQFDRHGEEIAARVLKCGATRCNRCRFVQCNPASSNIN